MKRYKAHIQYGVGEEAPWGFDIVWIDTKTIIGTSQKIADAIEDLKYSAMMDCYLPSHKPFADIAYSEPA